MAELMLDKMEYGRLLAERLPHRIETDAEYDAMAEDLERITFLATATAEERAYAQLAADLLSAYDRRQCGRPEASGAEVLELLLDARGLRQAALVPIVGSRAYVSQLLSGKRGISREMAKKLGVFFNADPSVFWS